MINLPRRTDSPPVIDRLIEHGWSVMLYDGDCNLCSGSVRFIAERSERSLLAFSAMQSESAGKALQKIGGTREINETLLVLTGSGVLRRSDAVLHLLGHMNAPWPRLARVVRLVPAAIRDSVYSVVAKNRYRVLGRRGDCMLRLSGVERRFLQ